MSDTTTLAPGQVWTITDTMGDGSAHRVRVIDVERLTIAMGVSTVKVTDEDFDARDGRHTGTMSVDWFLDHATLLHTSLDDAHAEALQDPRQAQRETIKPGPGQFWAMETNGHRVEVLSADRHAGTVKVWDWDCDHGPMRADHRHCQGHVSLGWFLGHATPLHATMAEAQLEALLSETARNAVKTVASLRIDLATEKARHESTQRDLYRVRNLLHEV